MELVNLLLIRLKIVLRYRLLLLVTIIHLGIAIIYVQNYMPQENINSTNYIISIGSNSYTTKDAIIYTSKEYSVGQLIQYKGQCIDNQQRNFIDFDYSKYLISNKVKCSLYEPQITTLNKRNSFYYAKAKIRNVFLRNDSLGFKSALIFGNRENISDHNKELFYNLHLAHLLALSGMHVGLISFLISTLLQKIIKVKEYLNIVVIITLTLYCLLIDYSYSIIRTFLIIYLVQFLNIVKFKINKLDIFLIVFNIVLFYNPYALYSYSFIYSFLCYFIIILCMSSNYNFIKLYLSITLFTIMITINLNNQINIVGLLAAPFITIVFEVLYFPYLLLSTILKINDVFSNVFIFFLDLIYSNKFNIIIKDFNIFSSILYYCLIFYIFSARKIKVLNVFICLCLIALPLAIRNNSISIMFFDVGQGDAILIELNNGIDILIDGGGNVRDQKKSDDIAKYIIIPYLKKQGINNLDYIIATHGDVDHIGSLNYIKNNYSYSNLYINCNEINEVEKELNGEKLYNLNLESSNYNINFNCVDREDENDSSIITYANFYDVNFLSLGDLSSPYEEQLKYDIDILKVSHHGSKSSTSRQFINNIKPEYAIISVGKNYYGHPTLEVLNNLEDAKVFRTDKNGAMKITISKDSKITCETVIPK